jgi:hypothetical protein
MKPISELSSCFPKTNRVVLLASVVLALCWGCGGSSSSSSPSTPTAVATPTPCTQATLLQQSGVISPSTLYILPVTVPSAGRLDLTVDWTVASAPVYMYLAQGSCSFEQFIARTCTLLLVVENSTKPKKGSVTVQPGTYTLLLGNAGTQPESGVAQAILSTGSCPAVASTGAATAAAPEGNRGSFQRTLPFRY